MDDNQRQMNELSLRVHGKNFSDLTREELLVLKKHPAWIAAAYGAGPKTIQRILAEGAQNG